MRVGVLSDTHIPSRAPGIPSRVAEVFEGVDLILHAGDVSVRAALDDLAALAPVHAVAGNIDDAALQAALPVQLRLDIGGVTVGMVHDSGPSKGRRERMRRRFPGARVVVYGHSHMPVVEDRDGLMLLNPGSACDPRQAKVPTVAILEIAGGDVSAELVVV
ncbi:MAG: yfcE: phosphodiesterase, family [Actinobacteria bacterium]|jgi:putative phosphoesterase|nr:yfcE: phosphodiesterase, family [Actinomycetota bacterium]